MLSNSLSRNGMHTKMTQAWAIWTYFNFWISQVWLRRQEQSLRLRSSRRLWATFSLWTNETFPTHLVTLPIKNEIDSELIINGTTNLIPAMSPPRWWTIMISQHSYNLQFFRASSPQITTGIPTYIWPVGSRHANSISWGDTVYAKLNIYW